MKHAILQFLRDEQGATAIEYALIASLIAVAIAASITALADQLKTTFASICSAVKGGGACS
ncbi:Flp family type IVb pilin [Ralstonia nicotianae]|uniref:Flp family type IVb pilin n=1 Tax=Ralstonia pseudosolanacearum TaxID=1310165 RepID=UPI0002C1085E|nr:MULTISPECIES: Flp family type IVb pilin [Ralstonia]ANH36073.1 Flp pilus assembly protein, pilin Flp [Ralstonia solanacearum]AGH86614.1 Flp pilus assembly protein, pilin Flp [Ralstonia pseudosolanacearum FQY_4]MCK4151382.1 Flp family type IVb pilin [Ralstonia pseudosolanacearum]MDC6295776.1 Flp family type IVb pilin [Ralstonia pseudosolanacearum]MDD7790828.1 Flp family type IVb pilin [Ralstonia pseudosolanacearum]